MNLEMAVRGLWFLRVMDHEDTTKQRFQMCHLSAMFVVLKTVGKCHKLWDGSFKGHTNPNHYSKHKMPVWEYEPHLLPKWVKDWGNSWAEAMKPDEQKNWWFWI